MEQTSDFLHDGKPDTGPFLFSARRPSEKDLKDSISFCRWNSRPMITDIKLHKVPLP